MVAHIPLHPRRAAEILQQAQIGDPYEVLANACEGGILKGYAGSTRIICPNGNEEIVLQRRIPPADWRRIIAEGKVADIANATVRLSGSADFDGGPKVTMIDIGFHERAVREYASRHGVQTSATAVSAPPSVSAPAAPAKVTTKRAAAAPPAVAPAEAPANALPLFDPPAPPPSLAKQAKVPKVVPPVSPGALVMTIAQAERALSVSRSTIYEWDKAGVLRILKGTGGSRIKVEDVDRLIASRA